MIVFLTRRLFQACLTLWIVSMLVFGVMFYASDPMTSLLPRNATAAQRERLAGALGIDRPVWEQYGLFIGRLFHGDLGVSYYHNRPVGEMIAERAPATIELAAVAMLMALGTGLPLGVWAGAHPGGRADRFVMRVSLLGVSVPTFWLGLILMMVFGSMLGWLPPSGRGQVVGGWSFLTSDGWRHLVMPAATLAFHHMAMTLRLTRGEMRTALSQPFIRVCRAKGVSEPAVIGKHALRNTLIPVVTVAGLQLGGLLAFSVVTETIFQWPGLGKLLIDSIYVDRPVVVAYLMLAAALFLAINFIVDMTYALIDPRIRLSSSRA